MTDQTVEYTLRVRIVEPPDRLNVPEENRIGMAMFEMLGEIETVAEEVEIVSRRPLMDPERPTRVRCAARTLDPSRHYSTTQRWQVTTPDGETMTMCSAACALSWLCRELPADIGQLQRGETRSEDAA
jgi:hypothetical protein